ncbi:ankyrin repeat-containing domain protein [Aspergillus pseudonomiae]|uniref:Ankyrin repeat-containing domain protein n=1 Tax=Aspergillus pseudonomiae TaxID=1506151 RepID=A0A5N7CU95_9EURO|nr:ankyrin repeat-containing domain protein [Aspergillus pseudonomiae]KAE8397694.1 ankyrin repeat-containing domain protein [Aspergillus pseudonomiae]
MCNKPKIPGGLQSAIEKGLSHDVQRYLDEGTSPDFCDKKNKQSQGKPLLALAAINDQIRIIELLINYGAKVDKRASHGRTPLSWAAEHGAFQAVKLLIEHGANVNADDKEWTAPLAWIVYAGREYSENAGLPYFQGCQDRNTSYFLRQVHIFAGCKV